MVATAALADELKQHSIEHWNNLLNHRFIAEMAADSLPIEKFAFYLRQDHIFLKEFCAFLLAAKQKSSDQKLAAWFGRLHCSTIDSEMQMQKELLLLLGIGNSATMAPATLNYASFLRKASSANSLEVMISSMAPCPWSYFEIAQKLSRNDIKTEAYCRWIQFYASDESRQQIEELKDNLGSLYDQADKIRKFLMKEHFGAACRHEHRFWEMAYNIG